MTVNKKNPDKIISSSRSHGSFKDKDIPEIRVLNETFHNNFNIKLK
jgi:hypothetical protein